MSLDKKRAAAEAAALTTALIIAAKVGWPFGRGPVPEARFANFLYVEASQLLLVPSTAGLPFSQRQLEPVIREARSDALIVSRPDAAPPTFAFASWGLDQTRWSAPLVLWLGEDGTPWLVPPTDDGDQLAIRLVNRLHRPASVPWRSPVERYVGYGRALDWMARVTGAARDHR